MTSGHAGAFGSDWPAVGLWAPDARHRPRKAASIVVERARSALGSGLLGVDFLGGTAVLPNGHAWGLDDDSWQFLCQFADRGKDAEDPFFLNFGYGSGFVFISSDHREGRFLADCI
ncbi:hypothetical protein ACFC0D_30610 [Streptomyces sp. NPDC056222]|uniref:hypothetical protein n=1 Tax=Streptomyces sp. NPDC056222 TaxID=3345749 RepID=UPI0035E113D4